MEKSVFGIIITHSPTISSIYIEKTVMLCTSTGLSEEGAGDHDPPPSFWEIIQPYLNQGGALCQSHYYVPHGFSNLAMALFYKSKTISNMSKLFWDTYKLFWTGSKHNIQ